MRKKIAVLISGVLLFLVILAGAGLYLVKEKGISAGIRFVDRLLPGTLTVTTAQGSLTDQFTLKGLHYADDSAAVAVDNFTLGWRPASLLKGIVDIRSLDVNGVRLDLTRSSQGAGKKPNAALPLPSFVLPMAVRVAQAKINAVELIVAKDAKPVRISGVMLENIAGEGGLVRIGHALITTPTYRMSAAGEVRTIDNYSARLVVTYAVDLDGFSPIEGKGELDGTPDALAVRAWLTKPFAASLEGTLRDLTGMPGWQGELLADQASLAEITSNLPAVDFARFMARGSGTLVAYDLQVQADVGYEELQEIHVKTGITGDVNGLRLTDVLLSRNEGIMAGEGWLDWHEAFNWQASVTGQNISLADINSEWPEVSFPAIAATGSGILETYSLWLNADAVYPGVLVAHVESGITGDADGLRFSVPRCEVLNGTLTGEGRLDWREAFTWQAEVAGKGIDPAGLDDRWPGRLNFTLGSSGRMTDSGVQSDIDLASLDGKLRGYPVKGKGRGQLAGNSLVLDGVHLETGGTELRASGRFGETADLGFKLQSADLAAIWPGLSGSLQAEGHMGGKQREPELELELSGDAIAWDSLNVGDLTAAIALDLSPAGTVQATITATKVAVADVFFDAVKFELKGSALSHQLQGELTGPNAAAEFALAGGLQEERWGGRIEQAVVRTGSFGNWDLRNPVILNLSMEEIKVGDLCLAGADSALVCADGEYLQTGDWQARAAIKSLPLSLFQGRQDSTTTLDGFLAGSLEMEGEGAEVVRGVAEISAEDAAVEVQLSGKTRQRIAWQSNALHARLVDGRLSADLDSTLKDGSFLTSAVTITDLHTVPFSLQDARIEGSVAVQVGDLQPLGALTFPAVEPHGSLKGNIAFSGNLLSPELHGQAVLEEKSRLIVPPLGITLENLALFMDGDDHLLRLRLTGSSGGGAVRADGTLALASEEDEFLNLNITGDRFEAVRLPELRLLASPDINMRVGRSQGTLKGKVFIPEAMITPLNLAGSVSPSDDVVIVDTRPTGEKRSWPLFAEITVLAGDNVRVDAFGLRGRVEGDLRVIDLPGKPATGNGSMNVRDGTFAIYGRELTIKTGRLQFSGGPLDNPGIEVQAENTASGVTTGIEVSGFLSEPEISFYSVPPMEEDQIIARLLMNSSLVGSSGKDTGFLGSVTSKTGLDPLTNTVREVKETLKVEDIKIETGKKSEDLSLVIGTWLTPSLYISYGKNLLRESGSFNTRYMLGHGFFMETETGATQSGVDLKYKLERK